MGDEVEVVNIAGRGGGNAWDVLHDRGRDDHVAAISSPTIITNRLLGQADIDDRDLTPIAQLCTEYLVFAVRSDATITSGARLATELATGSLAVSLAVARGNVNHMTLGAVIDRAGGAGHALEPRVFDSARFAIADLIEGTADVAVVSAASVQPELEAGLLRLLAVSAPERLSGPFKNTPTWRELGIEVEIGTWRGLVGPAGLASTAVSAWADRIDEAVHSESWREALDRYGWTPTHLGAAETQDFLARQREVFADALDGLRLL